MEHLGRLAAHERRVAMLKTVAGVNAGTSVLELGCGTGEFMEGLGELTAHLVATDVSPEFVARALDICQGHGYVDVAFQRATETERS